MAKVVIMSSDLTDAATLRRARSISGQGHELVTVSGRKGPVPDIGWRNIDLGEIQQQGLVKRSIIFACSLVRNRSLEGVLFDSDLVLARNIDMLLIAQILKWRSRAATKIGYEVLDIHSIFSGSSLKARMARMLERLAMKSIAVLYVSSKGFVRDYFSQVQQYSGPVHLVENKVSFGSAGTLKRPEDVSSKCSGLLRLGLVGAIRCRPSFELLLAAAEARPEGVELVFYGQIHNHVLPDAEERIATCANAQYMGAYVYPDGLARAYSECDIVWGQDLWQWDQNSRLLLPNRIYEAGWHGCPLIAVSGTETALKILETKQGWTIDAPTSDALLRLLDTLTLDDLAQCRSQILQLDEAIFREMPEDMDALLAAAGIR